MKNKRERNQVSQETNLFYYVSRKSTGCFCETIGCFYQQLLKTKTKTNLNEIRDRKINTTSFILVHSIPRATSSPQKPLSIPLSNHHLDYNTHQRDDLEPFKNTNLLWKTQPRIQNTL